LTLPETGKRRNLPRSQNTEALNRDVSQFRSDLQIIPNMNVHHRVVEHPWYGAPSTGTIEKPLPPEIWRGGVKTTSRPFAFEWVIALLSPDLEKTGCLFPGSRGGWTEIWLIGNRRTTRPGNRVHVRLWNGGCARESHETGCREQARHLKVADVACPSRYTVAWRKASPSMLG
jgi:hypothetical protein